MKVYLDLQIWNYINNDEKVKEFFEAKKEWEYFISVAHLEELYKDRRCEKGEKIGLTDKLEATIRQIAEDGVIKPKNSGVKFIPKCFKETYQVIANNDTRDIVLERSLNKRDMDKEAYDPKDLFDKVNHDKDNEYRLVWETKRVKDEISELKDNSNKLNLELSTPNNTLIKDYEELYGRDVSKQLISQLLNSSKIEIKPGIYQQIRDDYHALEYVIEQLYFVLLKCGFKREGSDRKANSGTYDIQHSICATLCDIFITNDNKFADKYKAVVYYLGIPIKIKTWDEILEEIPGYNCR